MDVRVCDVFLIEAMILVSCWVFSAWLVADAAKNSRSHSNCLVNCSEVISSFSATTTAMSSAKVLWNSPTIKKATALMTLITCSGILASNDIKISRFARVAIP